MLNFPADTKNEAKCSITHGTMGHVDPKQPPNKRKPFVTILNHQFIQKTEIILPEEVYEIMKDDFFADWTKPSYRRVILPLAALLDGEFFKEYIKKGNILMLSEREAGIDKKFYSLREGILTLYLDKGSYERAGLVGKPDGVKGKRGTKPRWIVEINLRLPSMLHGKKGFDRIVYAFNNVLNTPVTWLFHDLGSTTLDPDPLDAHFPARFTITPTTCLGIKANLPPLTPLSDTDSELKEEILEEYAVETLEWLAMISCNSPQIDPERKMVPILSRYVPPGSLDTRCTLVKVTWQGFIPPTWAHKLFVQLLLTVDKEAWFALSTVRFGEDWSGESKDSTILRLPNAPRDYMLWEVAV